MVYDTDLAITPERLDFLRSNSKVRVDKEGRWSMDGRLVEHPRVQRLFHSSVSVGEDGRPVLRVGPQWCYVQFVDDTVFFVERIRRGPDDRLVVVLADGAEEILRPESLTRRGETDVYCRLGNGHRARFLRDAVAGLAPWMSEFEGMIGLQLGDRFHAFAPMEWADAETEE